MVPRRVSCVGRRRPGGASRGNRGSNAAVGVLLLHRVLGLRLRRTNGRRRRSTSTSAAEPGTSPPLDEGGAAVVECGAPRASRTTTTQSGGALDTAASCEVSLLRERPPAAKLRRSWDEAPPPRRSFVPATAGVTSKNTTRRGERRLCARGRGGRHVFLSVFFLIALQFVGGQAGQAVTHRGGCYFVSSKSFKK